MLALGEEALADFRNRHIGFVFQFYNLMPVLTAQKNVELPLLLTHLSRSERKKRAAIALDIVGLSHRKNHFPRTLSGGEQQRAAIARALAHRPALLLADEPTGNLDEDTGDRIIELLTELARQQGTTMLLVTHSNRVAQAADRVLRLSHGRVEAD